ncbi:hypothetical protein KTD26_30865 [Burkholderia multivorans]|uniref:hypothetical protein n=2 Tax=Burkholderia cepacia complex TaxID=87882 RepID=UPI0007C7BECA|nr:hypothetical protein [Burkholderia multivorans]MBU9146912.1 hypothetical protein [Burkholderia multivorans]HEF4774544.1 hypothetical protein [Burkholderia multivorans]
MKPHRPHGPLPSALEANELKLRAFEMILIIFYVEDLRRFIIGAIRGTDEIFQQDDRLKQRNEDSKEKEPSESKIMRMATKALVDEGVISKSEKKELVTLINYRNAIGHEPHQLTVDVGSYSELAKTGKNSRRYDHTILERVQKIRGKIHKEAAKKFIMPIDFDGLMFEAAEKSYLLEIKRLKKKISKQIKQYKEQVDTTNQIIQSISKDVLDAAQPYHPRHYKRNGTLTESGISCVNQLFAAGATSLAVAHLMKISLKSSNKWYRRFKHGQPGKK